MKYFSTFSGIGGFELGIKQAYEITCRPNNSCDTIEACDVNNVKKKESFTPITNQPAKTVSDDTSLNGDKTIKKEVLKQAENIMPCVDKGCLKCMEGNVPAVESQRKSSLHSNISTKMDTKTESDTEQDTTISLHSKKKTLINTKYSATTATMQEDDMENVPTCVGFSEIDKYATQIYQRNFPGHKNFGDITKIDERKLPDFEMLVGGFPCQSFSIAGKRKGFDDTRGTMFFEIARIVREKQPRLLLLENVKGLLSHDQGDTFTTIISTLDELGYDCQWQVLNSKNHGVPQNRERVFIIGHLRGTPRPEVFPFGYNTEKAPKLSGQHSNTLTTRYYGGQANGTYVIEGQQHAQEIVQLNNPKHSNDRVYSDEGLSPTLNTMQGGNRQPFVKVPEATKKGYAEADEGDSINLSVPNSKTRRGRVGKGVAQTIDTGMQQHTLQHGSIRRLTPTECERLQGFPDHWTEGVSDSQRYKTIGNAVTVNVIKDICEQLLR